MITFSSVTYTYPFQDTRTVHDLSFTIEKGDVLLCTGMSGCGKSTLLRLINGLCPHYFEGTLTGEIELNSLTTKKMQLSEISSLVATLFQDPEQQFFALTVEDELAFALEIQNIPVDEMKARITEIISFLEMEDILHSSIYELSEGQKQKVAIASLLIQKPQILLLDEPTANLDEETTKELCLLLHKLKKSGLTIVIVDHRIHWLKDLITSTIIMHNGTITAKGTFSLLESEEIQNSYGLRKTRLHDPRNSFTPLSSENSFFVAENITFTYDTEKKSLFENNSFSFSQGIVAVLGQNGAGKTTLARILTGLTLTEKGTFLIEGQVISARDLLQHVSIVLQNTDHQLHMRTVTEEICASLSMLAKNEQETRLQELLSTFSLMPLAHRHPLSLSGGEKQRLAIACGLAKKPRILILDEPTSGLDGVNMKLVASALQNIAKSTLILLITHDLELLEYTCEQSLTLPIIE
ncbi:MAG: ABC transporter ATP-binding protein [Desulfovibrionaceae bacterium]